MINLVFPCAGKGERFGGVFKPFLHIGDMTFIEKAYEPFREWEAHIDNIYFIYTREQEEEFNVYETLITMFPKEKVRSRFLKKETGGPLETFREGIGNKKINNLIICDCDHSIDVDAIFRSILQEGEDTPDVAIPVWNITPEEQGNWSKILLQDDQVVDFKNKESVDFSRYDVRGIIGCIYFKSTEMFTDLPLEYVDFYKALESFYSEGKRFDILPVSTAYFFGDPEMLADCIEKRRNECTIFCDIDGVLLKHHDHSSTNPSENVSLPAVSSLRALSHHHKIVLTTARNKKYEKELVELLRDKGIPYDELITSLPSGPRILINDRKPKKRFTKQATACEISRDGELPWFFIERVTEDNKINIVSDLSENSFAKTYLLEKNGATFVRKHLLKNSVDERHIEVLKRQKDDLGRFNFLKERICPAVLRERDNELEYYYDMEYLDGYQILGDANQETQRSILMDLLEILNKDIYSLNKSIDGEQWMESFLNEKIYPKFDIFAEDLPEFDQILNQEVVTINGKEYMGLRAAFAALDFKSLCPDRISVVHGDLTLENIMFYEKTHDIKLIDTDGAKMFDAREKDLGKLAQSIISSYAKWKSIKKPVTRVDIANSRFKCVDKFFTRTPTLLEDSLVNKWSEMLECSHDETLRKAIFYMSTYFIRFVPFRLKVSKEHGIFALLMATVWINSILEKQ